MYGYGKLPKNLPLHSSPAAQPHCVTLCPALDCRHAICRCHTAPLACLPQVHRPQISSPQPSAAVCLLVWTAAGPFAQSFAAPAIQIDSEHGAFEAMCRTYQREMHRYVVLSAHLFFCHDRMPKAHSAMQRPPCANEGKKLHLHGVATQANRYSLQQRLSCTLAGPGKPSRRSARELIPPRCTS